MTEPAPHPTFARGAKFLLTTVLLPVAALLALAPTAAARVTIVPGDVPGGGTETFAVRVATTTGDSPTTRLELGFPAEPAVGKVKVGRVDGWKSEIDTRDDRTVRTVVLSGGAIKPGTFEQFLLTAGPLPDEGTLTFTVIQTHADGAVERWTADGPTITLTKDGVVPPPAAPTTTAAGPGAAAVVAADAAAPTPAPAEEPGSSPAWWTWAAGGAILLAGAGVAHLLVRPREHRGTRRAAHRRAPRSAAHRPAVPRVTGADLIPQPVAVAALAPTPDDVVTVAFAHVSATRFADVTLPLERVAR